MKQLKLTEEQLLRIGFLESEYYTENTEGEKETKFIFEINCLNGCFYYNPNEIVNTWYHKTVIGNIANYINLDIRIIPELYTVLSAFKVKYNTVII